MNLNFALILFVLSVVTGVIWCWDRFSLRKQRAQRLETKLKEFDQGVALSIRATGGEQAVHEARKQIIKDNNKMPWWLDYPVNFFPVIFVVFMLRSFVVEPFRIPSGSMIPTLQIGDMILVNKFTYGVRLPVINQKVVSINDPARGDVMVFRYPQNPSIDYIKRVVGLPGDTISYMNKRLSLNGVEVPLTADGRYLAEDEWRYVNLFTEQLGDHTHQIIVNDKRSSVIVPITSFPNIENCVYSHEGVECKVPDGHYFVMGDNRDNSEDSRYWGFVPNQNIVGKAFFVWMNFGDIKRIGSIN